VHQGRSIIIVEKKLQAGLADFYPDPGALSLKTALGQTLRSGTPEEIFEGIWLKRKYAFEICVD